MIYIYVYSRYIYVCMYVCMLCMYVCNVMLCYAMLWYVCMYVYLCKYEYIHICIYLIYDDLLNLRMVIL